MPKVVESRLIISAEDQATVKLKTIEDNLVKIGERLASLKDIELPDLGGLGPRGAGKRASTAGASRSPHAPQPDRIKPRGGTGWGGQPYFGWRGTGAGAGILGASGRAPSMAAGILGGAAAGAGTEELGSLLKQTGGGVMGAFGGLGAAIGLPLLGAGALLGLMNFVTGPAKRYHLGAATLERQLGEGFLRRQTLAGVAGGYAPEETKGYMERLYRVGAQEAWKPIAGMGYGRVRAEQMMPYVEAVTKGMRGGARTETEYRKMAKEIGAQVSLFGKSESVVELLEGLTDLTKQQVEISGEMDESSRKDMQVMLTWMTQTGSAMMRGGVGAQNLGKIKNWLITPGEPGAEMFKYGLLARNEEFRKYAEARGVLPRGAKVGVHEFQLMKELPLANLYFAQGAAQRMNERKFALTFGPYGQKLFTETEATKAYGLFRGGKSPEEVEKELAKARAKEEKTAPERPGTMGDRLRGLEATRGLKQIEIGEKFVEGVAKLDAQLVIAAGAFIENTGAVKAGTKILDGVSAGLKKFTDYLEKPGATKKVAGGKITTMSWAETLASFGIGKEKNQ